VDGFVLNDDMVLFFEKEEELETYIEIEDEVLEELGLIQKMKKSFQSWRYGVFCEEYFGDPILGKKESYRRREYNLGLCSVNICQAKAVLMSA